MIESGISNEEKGLSVRVKLRLKVVMAILYLMQKEKESCLINVVITRLYPSRELVEYSLKFFTE